MILGRAWAMSRIPSVSSAASKASIFRCPLFSAALGRSLPAPLRRGILVIEPPNFFEIDRRLRQLQLHIIKGVGDDLRDGEIAKPLVIGRNDKPRRVFG